MAYDPMSGNPFVTTTTTPTGTTYAETKAATPEQVISFVNAENQVARAAGFQTPISGGTPAGNVVEILSSTSDSKTGKTTQVQRVTDGWGGTTTKTVTFDTAGVGDTTKTGTGLAKDTFISTFALIFGAAESNKGYVGKLYDLVSGYYKSGSSVSESLNLALRQAKTDNVIPEFTDRFKGLFALDDLYNAGKATYVPTIAEFMKTESDMATLLNNAGLSDLATQEFTGQLIGLNKSVLEVGNLISDVFNTIDYAPTQLKETLATYFPGVDRTAIAKAILTGPEGAAALAQKVKGISVLSAAGTQGLKVDLATAQDIASMGYDYNQALTGFGQISSDLPTYEKLQEMKLGTDVKTADAQALLQKSTFGKDIAAQEQIKTLAQEEAARFKGTAGIIGSKALASQARATGLI